METQTTLSAETAEILESLTFIEKECLAAWQASAKTTKDLGLLREARACLQLKIKILGIDTPKPSPAPALPESQAPLGEPAISPETAPTPVAPFSPALQALRGEYTPEQFRALDHYTQATTLNRLRLSEAEARVGGYI